MLKLSLVAYYAALIGEENLENHKKFSKFCISNLGYTDKDVAKVNEAQVSKQLEAARKSWGGVVAHWKNLAITALEQELRASYSAMFPSGKQGVIGVEAPVIRNQHLLNALVSGIATAQLLGEFISSHNEQRWITNGKPAELATFVSKETNRVIFDSIALQVYGPKTVVAPALPPKEEKPATGSFMDYFTVKPDAAQKSATPTPPSAAPVTPPTPPAPASTSAASTAPAKAAFGKKVASEAPTKPEPKPGEEGYDHMQLLLDRDAFFKFASMIQWTDEANPDTSIKLAYEDFEHIDAKAFEEATVDYLDRDASDFDSFLEIMAELLAPYFSEEEEEAVEEEAAAA